MLFDWMILDQIVEFNPAQTVRGPRHVVKKGKTSVLDQDGARALLSSIDATNIVGLQDRAIIAVRLDSLARIEAALGIDVDDDFPPRGSAGGSGSMSKAESTTTCPLITKLKNTSMLISARPGFATRRTGRAFRTAIGGTKQVGLKRLSRHAALKMVQRRAGQAGIKTAIRRHSFRATGITDSLRTSDSITLDEVERIAMEPGDGLVLPGIMDRGPDDR